MTAFFSRTHKFQLNSLVFAMCVCVWNVYDDIRFSATTASVAVVVAFCAVHVVKKRIKLKFGCV